MRILAIIPARAGSKGIPDKNIKLLGGKPLMAYTTEVALQCKHLSKVIVSSEDAKIISIAKSLRTIKPAQKLQDTTSIFINLRKCEKLNLLEWTTRRLLLT